MTKTEYLAAKQAQHDAYIAAVLVPGSPYPETIRWAVKRGLAQKEDAKLKFDVSAAFRPCWFLEQLIQKQDVFCGRPLVLQDWQVWAIAQVYGWKNASTGRRLYRTALMAVPRKNGKSTLAGGLALYHLWEDAGGEVYTAAQDRAQASIIFQACRDFVDQTEGLAEHFRPRQYEIHSLREAGGWLRALHAEAERLRGLNASAVIYDEFFDSRQNDLFQTLKNSQGARTEPLMFMIGSHTSMMSGFAFEFERSLKASPPADTFLMIFEPDPGDDLNDERTWQKVNPNWGVSIVPESFRSQYDSAKLSTSLLNQWQNFCLNKWTATSTGWLSTAAVDQVIQKCDPIKKGSGLLAFDLAAIHDLASFALLTWDSAGQPRMHFRHFIPDRSLQERLRLENPLYLDWIDQGYIFTTPGATIDNDLLFDIVIDWLRSFDLDMIGVAHDAWKARELVKKFTDEGLDCVAIPQNFSGVGVGLAELEAAILRRELLIDDDPVFRWALSNVELIADKNGNRKPVKPQVGRDRTRIDPVLAAVMAWYRYRSIQVSGPPALNLEAFDDDLFKGW